MLKTKDEDMTQTMTLKELGDTDWAITVEHIERELESYEIDVRETADGGVETATQWVHWHRVYVTLTHGEISIGFDAIATGGKDSWEAAHRYLVDVDADAIEGPTLTGVSIVDDDGEPVNRRDIESEIQSSVSYESAVRAILPDGAETEDLDMTGDGDMDEEIETYTVERDDGPSLRFRGRLLGAAASDADRARGGSNWSGQVGRWCVLRLYQTVGGKYVCQQIGRTQWQGEHDRYSAAVCETIEDVAEFFGHGWLAKALYAEAGIDIVEEVD